MVVSRSFAMRKRSSLLFSCENDADVVSRKIMAKIFFISNLLSVLIKLENNFSFG